MTDRPIFITPEGYRRLQGELQQLWSVERPRVTQEVADAAALGDRSENAEYIYGKKRLREIDRRIQWLSKRLDALTVLDPKALTSGKIGFGAWVTVEDEDGKEITYQLVGPDEFDVSKGRISVESPVGRALLGKEIGDEVEIDRPRGKTTLAVVRIEYR